MVFLQSEGKRSFIYFLHSATRPDFSELVNIILPPDFILVPQQLVYSLLLVFLLFLELVLNLLSGLGVADERFEHVEVSSVYLEGQFEPVRLLGRPLVSPEALHVRERTELLVLVVKHLQGLRQTGLSLLCAFEVVQVQLCLHEHSLPVLDYDGGAHGRFRSCCGGRRRRAFSS